MSGNNKGGAGKPSAGTKAADDPAHKRKSTGAKQRGLAQVFRTGYSYEGIDRDDYLETPWVKPDVIKGRDHYHAQLYEKGQLPICKTRVKQFTKLGAGVVLHFKLVGYVFWFFFLATCAVITSIIIAYQGKRVLPEQRDPLRLSLISIANVGDASLTSQVNYTVAPWSVNPNFEYSMADVANILMASDLAYTLMLILFIFFVYGRIKAITAEVETNELSASDYAVFVTGLPKDATEPEIRDHFNRLYNLRQPDWTYASSWTRCLWRGRKMTQRKQFKPPVKGAAAAAPKANPRNPRAPAFRELRDEDVYPVLDARNSGNPDYVRSWVAEVSVATANGSSIKRYQALTGLVQRVRQARATVKKYNKGSPFADETKRTKAKAALDKLQARLDAINKAEGRKISTDTVGAFVTFNNEESVRRCLQDYSGSDSWLSISNFWFQATPLRFRGKDRLTCVHAPDPSQIVWQNLELSSANRLCRQMTVNGLLLALLVISFIFIILAQAQQAAFRAAVPKLSLCDTILPAISYGLNVTSTGQLAHGESLPIGIDMVHHTQDAPCSTMGEAHIFFQDDVGTARLSSMNNSNPCYDECVSTSSTSTTSCTYTFSDGVRSSFPTSSVVACYCTLTLQKLIASKGIFTGAQSLLDTEGPLCGQVAVDYVTYNAFVIVASAIVVTINMFLRTILQFITQFEGHPSVGSLQKAIALKVFLSLFLNTACIVLLINAALPSTVSSLTLNGRSVFAGQYTGFDVNWQVAVGTSIVLTMLINTISPHAYNVGYMFCYRPCRRLTGDRSAVTQAELNKAYTPPDMEMSTRTALWLNTFFSCLMYSSGHPILLAVATFSFFITYHIDKMALLRMYRKPPRFTNAMAVFAQSLFKYAVIIHLLIAIWMYSDPNVLYSPPFFSASGASETSLVTGSGVSTQLSDFLSSASSSDSSGINIIGRISRENTLPLFVLLCLFVLGWLLYSTAGVFLMALLSRCCACVSGGRCCADTHGYSVRLHFNPPYTGPYALPLDPRKKHKLLPHEEQAGWRIVKDTRGHLVKIRIWTSKGHAFGMAHAKGQRMLTWEVLARAGIASFDIAANPVYAPAIRAMEMGRARVEGGFKSARGFRGPSTLIRKLPSHQALPASAAAAMAASQAGPGHRPAPSTIDSVANPAGVLASPTDGTHAAGTNLDAAAVAAAAALGYTAVGTSPNQVLPTSPDGQVAYYQDANGNVYAAATGGAAGYYDPSQSQYYGGQGQSGAYMDPAGGYYGMGMGYAGVAGYGGYGGYGYADAYVGGGGAMSGASGQYDEGAFDPQTMAALGFGGDVGMGMGMQDPYGAAYGGDFYAQQYGYGYGGFPMPPDGMGPDGAYMAVPGLSPTDGSPGMPAGGPLAMATFSPDGSDPGSMVPGPDGAMSPGFTYVAGYGPPPGLVLQDPEAEAHDDAVYYDVDHDNDGSDGEGAVSATPNDTTVDAPERANVEAPASPGTALDAAVAPAQAGEGAAAADSPVPALDVEAGSPRPGYASPSVSLSGVQPDTTVYSDAAIAGGADVDMATANADASPAAMPARNSHESAGSRGGKGSRTASSSSHALRAASSAGAAAPGSHSSGELRGHTARHAQAAGAATDGQLISAMRTRDEDAPPHPPGMSGVLPPGSIASPPQQQAADAFKGARTSIEQEPAVDII